MSRARPPRIWESVWRASFSRSKRSLESRLTMERTCHLGKSQRRTIRKTAKATAAAGMRSGGNLRKTKASASPQKFCRENPG